MPRHVQELILADNPGVTAHVIAKDALGLIRQDVQGRHSELLAGILDLLRHLTLSSPPSEKSELRGSPLPIALLPVFFKLTPLDLMKWKQVAARFNELITEASGQPQLNERRSFNFQSTMNSVGNNANNRREMENSGSRDINFRNLRHVGEINNVLSGPLHQGLAASRLHPLIRNINR